MLPLQKQYAGHTTLLRTGFQHPITTAANQDIALDRRHCTVGYMHTGTQGALSHFGVTTQAKPSRNVKWSPQ